MEAGHTPTTIRVVVAIVYLQPTLLIGIVDYGFRFICHRGIVFRKPLPSGLHHWGILLDKVL